MKIVLLGRTGRTGRHVLRQALARGHSVTALVRGQGTDQEHERLQTVVGSPLCLDDLVPILAGHDVVISCLGQRSRRDAELLHRAASATLEAMSRTGVRRLLVISQGLLFPSRNPIVALLRLILARHIADSTAMEN